MRYWLLKTEPEEYSYSDLERDSTTVWDGVSNPLALKHLRTMEIADLVNQRCRRVSRRRRLVNP